MCLFLFVCFCFLFCLCMENSILTRAKYFLLLTCTNREIALWCNYSHLYILCCVCRSSMVIVQFSYIYCGIGNPIYSTTVELPSTPQWLTPTIYRKRSNYRARNVSRTAVLSLWRVAFPNWNESACMYYFERYRSGMFYKVWQLSSYWQLTLYQPMTQYAS